MTMLSSARTHESRRSHIIADAHAGVGPELRKKREEKGTFGAVAAAFMRDFAHSHRTTGEMQRKIDVDLADWHDRQIADITRADIKEMIRLKARTAPIAANRLLSLITKIFNWALKEELIAGSPAMQIDRPGKETERERSSDGRRDQDRMGSLRQARLSVGLTVQDACSSPASVAAKSPA